MDKLDRIESAIAIAKARKMKRPIEFIESYAGCSLDEVLDFILDELCI